MNAPQRSHLALFWLLAVVGFTADLASKYGIHAWLHENSTYLVSPGTWAYPVAPGVFDLQIHYEGSDPHVNRGAINGLLNGWLHGNSLFAVVSLLAGIAIIYWVRRPAVRGDRVLCVALGLILGGTLGNLYDRLVFGGVRDFLHWHYGFVWPDFNIADSCLVCGAALLLLHAVFATEEQAVSQPEALTTTTPANGI